MKQRITYLHPQGFGIDKSEIVLGNSDLQYANAGAAAQERRYTFGLSELPIELQNFLESFHELHIRIGSFQPYRAYSPALSRVSPGLHAFFTPRSSEAAERLCPTLQQFLGDDVKCGQGLDSFSQPDVLSKRFTSASSYQFYHVQIDPEAATHRWDRHLCGTFATRSKHRNLCDIVSSTAGAAYVDWDYDAISHALIMTVMFRASAQYASLGVWKMSPEDRVEVGIFQAEPAEEAHELSLGGFLAVVGEDDHISPTMFSFPSRHHPTPFSYHVSFQQPTGLHPKLDITFPHQPPTPPSPNCALHAYWTLPSTLFIDRYQLSDLLLLASLNLRTLHSLTGAQDLEAPDWTTHQWGSAALFELASPPPTNNDTDSSSTPWKVTIPTHLRYIRPVPSTPHTTIPIPWPVLFYACPSNAEGPRPDVNPFDRTNLGYDGLFGDRTTFHHLSPRTAGLLVRPLKVPTLADQGWSVGLVVVGTVLAVVLGFGWVFWVLIGKGQREDLREKKRK